MEEILKVIAEFWEENKEWLNPAISAAIGALIAWVTSLFRTRASRLEDIIDGKHVYDDNDEVFVDGKLIPLGKCTIVRKGKNADETKGD